MLIEHLPALNRYASTRFGQNAEDIVQDTCVKLLSGNYEDITEAYVISACKSVNLDRDKYTRNKYSFVDIEDTNLSVLPEAEELIYAKELGIDIYNWKDNRGRPKKVLTPEDKERKRKLARERDRRYRQRCITSQSN
jgi:DNA-directed RNA polymerase specialized sigma24 family protein